MRPMIAATAIYPSSLAAWAIEAYQRFISPYKGFGCAHRAVHGRDSCSQFAKRVALKRGILALFPLLRRRFTECGVAAQVLDHESREKHRTAPRIREESRSSSSSSSCGSQIGDAVGEGCVEAACQCGPDIACNLLDGL